MLIVRFALAGRFFRGGLCVECACALPLGPILWFFPAIPCALGNNGYWHSDGLLTRGGSLGLAKASPPCLNLLGLHCRDNNKYLYISIALLAYLYVCDSDSDFSVRRGCEFVQSPYVHSVLLFYAWVREWVCV